MAETDPDPQPIPGGSEHPFASIIAAYHADHAPAAEEPTASSEASTPAAAAVAEAPEPVSPVTPDFAKPPTAPIEPPVLPLQRANAAAESVIAAFQADVAAAPVAEAAGADAATPFLAPTEAADAGAEPTPVAAAPAKPRITRGRRVAQVAPIGLLAVLTAVAAVAVHGAATRHDTAPTDTPVSAPSAPSISFSPIPSTSRKKHKQKHPSEPKVSPAAYTRALTQIRTAGTAAAVTSAVDSALPGIRAVAAHPSLAPAERADLHSLAALVAVAAVDVPGAIDNARTAAKAVGAAGGPTPTGATDHAVSLAGATALFYLKARLDTLAGQMASASDTAGLRAVAASAAPTARFAEELVTRLAGTQKQDAETSHSALAALGAMSSVDGDHLSLWSTIAPTLRQALSAAGVTNADTDVADASAMIGRAQATLDAWSRSQGSSADTKAIEAYESAVQPLWSSYASAVGSIPRVSATTFDSSATDNRFGRAAKATQAALRSLNAVQVPQAVAAAQAQARAAFARGSSAGSSGQDLALDAEGCLLRCTYGSVQSFPAYARAIDALGSAASAQAAWQAAVNEALGRSKDTAKPVV